MQSKVIQFNKTEHDDFIDFIKAYAILCVLFGHTFGMFLDKVAYGVWAGMQVPLFILIQTFHGLKKEGVTFIFAKVFKRVFLPFFLVEVLTFIFTAVTGVKECNALIMSGLIGGWVRARFLLPMDISANCFAPPVV